MEKGHDGQTDAIDKRLSVSAAADSRVNSTRQCCQSAGQLKSNSSSLRYRKANSRTFNTNNEEEKTQYNEEKKHSEEEKHTRPFSRD